MRKEIIVNANKDRARIAIVEDGQLVELYVENPDNVRSIGNIVLGRVQKVKPEIKAAFVDIGQKQDAFLHFSDLTDNLPALLSLAGEDIPGLDIPVLQTRPQKRVADDEQEADVEEKLEVVDTSDDEDKPKSRRRRRRRSGSGRGRGRGRRREEEEEEEEKPRPGFMMLDLTGGGKKSAPKREEPKAEEKPEAKAEPEAEEKPKKGRARRAKKSNDSDAQAPDTERDDSADEKAEKPKSSRRRSKKSDEPKAEEQPDTQDQAEATPDSEGKPKGRRRRSKKQDEAKAEKPEAGASAPVSDDAEEKPKGRRRKKQSEPADEQPDAGDAQSGDERADAKKGDEPKGRRRRSKKSDSDQPKAEEKQEDSAEEKADDGKPKGRRRSKKQDEAKAEDAKAEESADASGEQEDASEADERPKPRGRRQRRSRRTRSGDDSSPQQDDPSEKDDAPDGKNDDSSKGNRGRRSRRSRNDDDQTGTPDSSEQADDASEGDGQDVDQDSGRGRRGRRSRRSRSSDDSGSPRDDASADDDQKDDGDGETGGRRRGRRRQSDGDSDSRGPSKNEDASGDAKSDGAKDGDDGSSTQDDGDSRRSSRGRGRGRGRGRKNDQQDQKDDGDETKSSDDKSSGRSGRDGRGRGGNGKPSSQGSSINLTPSGPQKPPHEYIRRGQAIPVKITKEPISAKGSRVSTDTSLAGRFLVLVPLAEYVAVSKKIESSKERRRLKTLATSLKPDGFGVIVRTVAAGRDAKSLDTDMRLLLDKWRKIEQQLRSKPKPPKTLYEDVNMVSSILRDLFSEDYDRILIDDPALFQKVRSYVGAVAPQMVDAVQPYRGNVGVFRSAGIEKQVAEAFSTRVNLRSGGYLFIETTEAMHVVDVNSGRSGRGKSQIENLLAVNVESAREIAKQLRLRDLGGIIVVDFIDMKSEAHRKKITDALKEEFKKDRAVTKFLPMSDFGLVQITRQRLRPSITAGDADGEEAQQAAGAAEIAPSNGKFRGIDEDAIVTDASVPVEEAKPEPQQEPKAERSGRKPRREAEPEGPRPSLSDLVGQIEAWLKHYRGEVDEKFRHRPLLLRVHPLLASHLQRGLPSRLLRWRLQMPTPKLRLDLDETMDPLAFDVLDEKSGKPLTKKYAK
jgi:ribonuclease G